MISRNKDWKIEESWQVRVEKLEEFCMDNRTMIDLMPNYDISAQDLINLENNFRIEKVEAMCLDNRTKLDLMPIFNISAQDLINLESNIKNN